MDAACEIQLEDLEEVISSTREKWNERTNTKIKRKLRDRENVSREMGSISEEGTVRGSKTKKTQRKNGSAKTWREQRTKHHGQNAL